MEIEYKWARSLRQFLWENYKELIEKVEKTHEDAFINSTGEVFIGEDKVDLSGFEFKDILIKSGIEGCLNLWGAEDLLECEDSCAEFLVDIIGWSIFDSIIYVEEGKVRYSDFLPQKGKVDEWKSGKIPVRLTEGIKGFHDMLNLACGDVSFKFWGREYLSLLRFYMSDKGLTLGVWSHQRVNYVDELYGELYYSEVGGYNTCIENGISTIVSEILRLGVPVRDVFILLYGNCDKMYYRKNKDGEYTITIY